MIEDFPYRFRSSDTGVFAEIYLPKKARFQGTLYDALTKGFEREHLRRHFKDPARRLRIQKLLEKYRQISQYDDAAIDNLEEVFYGYSLYEVDGVFLKTHKGSPPQRKVIEERTQVIRLMFLPDVDRFLRPSTTEPDGAETRLRSERDFQELTRLYLRRTGSHETFLEQTTLDPAQMAVVQYLRKWVSDIGMFLFGYVVYEICARVLQSVEDGAINVEEVEDEIWVTSFWNLVVNKIEYQRAPAVAPSSTGV